MSTVSNVQRWNIPANVSTFRGFWELSRAMKKAGWKYKASSNGTTKDTTGDPALDRWLVTSLATNAGAAAASITAIANGRATVTGLTGIVSEDKGRFITFSGANTAASNNQHQIEEVLSATSVRIDARQFAVVAPDVNNGALTWSIKDPMRELYSLITFGGAVAWWCAQGPSVLKIPITAASAGTFKRGENLVQTSTGAEGELVSYTYYNNVGWLVVAPRLRGSGAGAHGWDTANLVTGGTSGATVTQIGSAIDYVHEVVFNKSTTQVTIQVVHVLVDKAAESAQLFSVLATSAGCTATVFPAGGGTGNAFPAFAWLAWGAAITPAASGITTTQSGAYTAHISCVDAIPEQGYSADGTYSLFYISSYNGVGPTSAPVGHPLHGLHRLEDVEDGELALYVAIAPTTQKSFGSQTRTSVGTIVGIYEDLTFHAHDTTFQSTALNGMFSGWRCRGSAPVEIFAELSILAQKLSQTAVYAQGITTNIALQTVQASARPGVRMREKIWLISQTSVQPRGFKGTFRWLYWVNGGQMGNAYEGELGWVQMASPGANPGSVAPMSGGAMVVGPHDGTQVIAQPAG